MNEALNWWRDLDDKKKKLFSNFYYPDIKSLSNQEIENIYLEEQKESLIQKI